MPDLTVLTLVALAMLILGLVTGAFVGERAVRRELPATPAPPEPVPRRTPNAHVHTWRHRSSEDTAGEHVEIYHCLDCAAIERRIVQPPVSQGRS